MSNSVHVHPHVQRSAWNGHGHGMGKTDIKACSNTDVHAHHCCRRLLENGLSRGPIFSWDFAGCNVNKCLIQNTKRREPSLPSFVETLHDEFACTNGFPRGRRRKKETQNPQMGVNRLFAGARHGTLASYNSAFASAWHAGSRFREERSLKAKKRLAGRRPCMYGSQIVMGSNTLICLPNAVALWSQGRGQVDTGQHVHTCHYLLGDRLALMNRGSTAARDQRSSRVGSRSSGIPSSATMWWD